MLTSRFGAWPQYDDDDIRAVTEVMRSGKVNYWTGGECREFERDFAGSIGVEHAIALANGTVAIDLALAALGVGPGDEVIVTPRSFIASVSSVINRGATPIFVDVDRDSGCMAVDAVDRACTARTKAAIPVHLAGWPADMEALCALAQERRFAVIEDCAQAHGAQIGGRSVGSFGEIGAWSFCQDKIMTTGGEGGMVTTDDQDLWNRMWSYKDHGKAWDAVYNREHPPGFRWVHETIGTNWRMIEMQAVIGRNQLRQLASWTARRTAIANRYTRMLRDFSALVRVATLNAAYTHAYYRFYAYVETSALADGWSRDRIVAEVNRRGGLLQQGSCSEIYLERAFDGTGLRPAERLPVAKELGETSLMFYTHPTLSDEDVDVICNITADVLNDALR